MVELNEEIVFQIDDLFSSMEKSKSGIEKKFKCLLQEFVEESWNNFDDYLTTDARYRYEHWIRQTCDEIIESLLSGETRWLKDQHIISEYTWEKLQKVRLKIWETAGGEIANCTINALQKEIEYLKEQNKRLSDYRNNHY